MNDQRNILIAPRSLDRLVTEGGVYLTVLGRWSEPDWNTCKNRAYNEVFGYLYSGAVVSVVAVDDVDRVVVTVVVPTTLVEQTTHRLQSGLFGVQAHATLSEAQDRIVELI